MSIKAYVGRMGSGKTYEVVSVVIYGALKRGRRVVSNIAGLNHAAMLEAAQAEGIDPEKFGELVQVEHAAVMQANFWRTDKDEAQQIDSFIKPGDLVALDEIWRFWSGFGLKGDDGTKRPERVMNFFRMHRHFTHPETGVACDVALITQDVMDIARSVRAVIEETYEMTKLTAIGSAKRYRVDVHQGGKKSRKPLRSIQRGYEAKFFPFYSSHSQKKEGDADAKEENIDQRGNILKGALFKVVLPVGLVLGAFAVWTVYKFFNPTPKPDNKTAQAKPAAASPAAAPGQTPAPPAKPEVVEQWRIVGHATVGGVLRVLMASPSGGSRWLVAPHNVKMTSLTTEIILPNGDAVASWSSRPAPSIMPGAQR